MNLNNFVQDKKFIFDLFKEKKFLRVIKLGKKFLKKNPNALNLIYILGLSSINVENFTDAESYFKKLLLLKIEISLSEIISTSCCCAKGPVI